MPAPASTILDASKDSELQMQQITQDMELILATREASRMEALQLA